MGLSFRHSAGFGKRMEYNLVGKMLMERLDVYLPLVDDHEVDCTHWYMVLDSLFCNFNII